MLKRKINPSTGETKPGRSRVRSHSVITARPCLHKKRFTPDTHKKKVTRMVFPYLTPRKLTSAFRSITMQICVTYLNGTSSAILAHWEKRERGREKEEEGEEKRREGKGKERERDRKNN
jgi:hypothetical protein